MAHALFTCAANEWKGGSFEHPGALPLPFPAVNFLVKEYKKKLWCSFYIRRQSDSDFSFNERQSHLTGASLLMHAGPGKEPQRHSTCGMCPSFFIGTCICGCVWVGGVRHHNVRVLSSCVWRRSSERSQFKVTAWELEVSESEGCCWTCRAPSLRWR